MKYLYMLFIILIPLNINLFSETWDSQFIPVNGLTGNTASFDINNDETDELVFSFLRDEKRYLGIYSFGNSVSQYTKKEIAVPENALFYDIADLNLDGKGDLFFLMPDKLRIFHNILSGNSTIEDCDKVKYSIIKAEKNNITNIDLIHDLDNDGKNELVIVDVDSLKVYTCPDFSLITDIPLNTQANFSTTINSSYPAILSYAIPWVYVEDLNNDKKQEIIIDNFGQIQIFQIINEKWQLAGSFKSKSTQLNSFGSDNISLSVPIFFDADQDGIKDIVICGADANILKRKFKSLINIYYLDTKLRNYDFLQVVEDKLPSNIPIAMDTNNDEKKDIIISFIPFNLSSLLSMALRGGLVGINYYFYQNQDGKISSEGEKVFSVNIRFETGPGNLRANMIEMDKITHKPTFYFYDYDAKKEKITVRMYYYDASRLHERYRSKLLTTYNYKRTEEEKYLFRALLSNLFGSDRKEVIIITGTHVLITYLKSE